MKNKMKKNTLLLLFGCLLFLLLSVGVHAEVKAYDYLVPEAESRYYTDDEFSEMSLQVLCYAKNEIYARHGRMFQSKELSAYFKEQPWYEGTIKPSAFSEDVFNKYELANAMKLSKLEHQKNAQGYPIDKPGYSFQDVYDYLDMISEPSISNNLSYSVKTRLLKSDYFQLTIPEAWAGRWTYSDSDRDSITFYCKAVNEADDDYDGALCTILREKKYRRADDFPSADYLGKSDSYYFYLLYPTDVRYNPNKENAKKIYRYMSKYTEEIVPTFKPY